MIATTKTGTITSTTTVVSPPPYIHLRVLTDAGIVLEEDEVVSIVAPGELGYLGILRNHAPLVTTLKPGTLTWRTPEGAQRTRLIGDGFLEIVRNRCTLLTSSVQEPSGSASHGR